MQLELKHVKKDFVSKRGRHYECLEDMNLVVQSGEFHLLYGATNPTVSPLVTSPFFKYPAIS